MPPRPAVAAASSMFNLTSLLKSLPSFSRNQALTKCSACLFSTAAPLQTQTAKKRKLKPHIDPYRMAQARQRKQANLARQKVLKAERAAALGDPVRSRPSPFVQSLHSRTVTNEVNQEHLNYYLKRKDVEASQEYSKWLSEPQPAQFVEPGNEGAHEEALKQHEEWHENASRALFSIASLGNASSKDKTRLHIQRCIDEFGRHKTDGELGPRLRSTLAPEPVIRPRVGADTGSSEVQIAILTAKINVLADNLHHKDKQNKRNLRLLVHRRQKHLKYLRRQDKGGPRWQNVVEKLGITDAMWKGEISM
ncbi:ribosomal protein S15 [Exophiala mesophila]|uniref:Ribosomal protein S15 n=1 Tax=Exophiala mesophila TaxID=212818 RepID=A0A0D1ZLK6_EXOME|nr:ribosomal protein S15 [Exophiala mesophila]KIV94824.1 ribosomal protein S15 [Exophiala mesophila]